MGWRAGRKKHHLLVSELCEASSGGAVRATELLGYAIDVWGNNLLACRPLRGGSFRKALAVDHHRWLLMVA